MSHTTLGTACPPPHTPSSSRFQLRSGETEVWQPLLSFLLELCLPSSHGQQVGVQEQRGARTKVPECTPAAHRPVPRSQALFIVFRISAQDSTLSLRQSSHRVARFSSVALLQQSTQMAFLRVFTTIVLPPPGSGILKCPSLPGRAVSLAQRLRT